MTSEKPMSLSELRAKEDTMEPSRFRWHLAAALKEHCISVELRDGRMLKVLPFADTGNVTISPVASIVQQLLTCFPLSEWPGASGAPLAFDWELNLRDDASVLDLFEAVVHRGVRWLEKMVTEKRSYALPTVAEMTAGCAPAWDQRSQFNLGAYHMMEGHLLLAPGYFEVLLTSCRVSKAFVYSLHADNAEVQGLSFSDKSDTLMMSMCNSATPLVESKSQGFAVTGFFLTDKAVRHALDHLPVCGVSSQPFPVKAMTPRFLSPIQYLQGRSFHPTYNGTGEILLNLSAGMRASLLPARSSPDVLQQQLAFVFTDLASSRADSFVLLLLALAHLVQYPNKKLERALIIYSETKGVGKDLLLEPFCGGIIGFRSAQPMSSNDLADDFANLLVGKTVVYVQEMRLGKEDRPRFKAMMTQATLNINEKFKPKTTVPNHISLIATINELPGLEHDCRRTWIIQNDRRTTSWTSEQRERYYTHKAQLFQQHRDVFATFLLSIDVSEFYDAHRSMAIDSSAMDLARLRSVNPTTRNYVGALLQGRIPLAVGAGEQNWMTELSSSDFHVAFHPHVQTINVETRTELAGLGVEQKSDGNWLIGSYDEALAKARRYFPGLKPSVPATPETLDLAPGQVEDCLLLSATERFNTVHATQAQTDPIRFLNRVAEGQGPITCLADAFPRH